jgi:hypothetical protein
LKFFPVAILSVYTFVAVGGSSLFIGTGFWAPVLVVSVVVALLLFLFVTEETEEPSPTPLPEPMAGEAYSKEAEAAWEKPEDRLEPFKGIDGKTYVRYPRSFDTVQELPGSLELQRKAVSEKKLESEAPGKEEVVLIEKEAGRSEAGISETHQTRASPRADELQRSQPPSPAPRKQVEYDQASGSWK